MTIAIIDRPKGLKFLKTELSVTDGRTDRQTDRRTDRQTEDASKKSRPDRFDGTI